MAWLGKVPLSIGNGWRWIDMARYGVFGLSWEWQGKAGLVEDWTGVARCLMSFLSAA
jgi:hypothetical protein